MNAKTWIPLSAAAVLGTGAAYVGFTLVSQTPVRVAAKPVELATLVIAARDVPAGTRLEADDLRVMSVKPGTLPEGFAADPAAAVGRVVIEPLHAGQAIGDALLAAADTQPGLAAVLPKGYRAITLELTRPAGVAEFLKPDARVDVVSGIRDGEEMSVRTVAQNLRVLAVDGLMAGQKRPEAEEGKSEPPPSANSNVTLMVTLEQAAAVELATVMGKPRLTLRAGGDQELSPFEGLTLAELRGVRPTNPTTPAVAQATPPQLPGRDPFGVSPWEPTQPVYAPSTRPSSRPTADPFARSETTTTPPAGGEWPQAVRYVEVIRGGVRTREAVPMPSAGKPADDPKAADTGVKPDPAHEFVGNDTRPAAE